MKIKARLFTLLGSPTGIKEMSDGRGKMSDVWYDLSGRRVHSHLERGIYIINGKKIVF